MVEWEIGKKLSMEGMMEERLIEGFIGNGEGEEWGGLEFESKLERKIDWIDKKGGILS